MEKNLDRTSLLEKLADLVQSITITHPTCVAIDGFSTSGKTRLADDLAVQIEESGRQVIRAQLDDFKRPWSERDLYDRTSGEGYYRNAYDYAAIRNELLKPLGQDGSREFRSAKIDPMTQEPVEDASGVAADDAILVADGVFLFRPELNTFWDFRVFVDIDFDLVRKRGSIRDAHWTGSRESAEELYDTRYIPSERIYVSEVDPKRHADVIIDNRNFDAPILHEKG